MLGAPGATSDPAPGGCPSPQHPSPPPSPSAGEGTAPTREKRRCGVGGPAASSALTPLSPPERWTALPDFPDHDKWGFSLAALNSSVYVTGEARSRRPGPPQPVHQQPSGRPHVRGASCPSLGGTRRLSRDPSGALWRETDVNSVGTGPVGFRPGFVAWRATPCQHSPPGPCPELRGGVGRREQGPWCPLPTGQRPQAGGCPSGQNLSRQVAHGAPRLTPGQPPRPGASRSRRRPGGRWRPC